MVDSAPKPRSLILHNKFGLWATSCHEKQGEVSGHSPTRRLGELT
jgi:hypothetical protein